MVIVENKPATKEWGQLQSTVPRKQRPPKRWLEALNKLDQMTDAQHVTEDMGAAGGAQVVAMDDATRPDFEGSADEADSAKWRRVGIYSAEVNAARLRVGEWGNNDLGLFATTRFHA